MAWTNNIEQQKQILRTTLKQTDIEAVIQEMQELVDTKDYTSMKALLNDIQSTITMFNSRNCSELEIQGFLANEVSHLSILFTKGYALIHRLREKYTGELITYTYTYRRGGDLYIRENISETEILSTIGFTGYKRVNSLIARMKVKPSYKGAKKFSSQYAKIFKQLQYLNSKAVRGSEPLTKAGYLHEVFVLLTQPGSKYQSWLNNPKLMYLPENRVHVYELFRQARQNNIPFYKSGDIGNVQLKLWDSAAPSLANLNTIAIVLQQFLKGQEALDKINIPQTEKIINKLIFTTSSKEQVINELLNLGVEKAEKAVEDFLKQANISLTFNTG